MQTQKSVMEYQTEVASRLGDMTREEATSLLEASNSPGFVTLTKVMGPELSGIVTEVVSEIKNALQPKQVNPQTTPMKKGGLVSRPNKKPIAKK